MRVMDVLPTSAIVNSILSLMVGMVLWGVRSINGKLAAMNGRLSEHIESKDLHYAAQARVEGQINSLLQVSQALHARVDRIEEARG